MASNISLFPTLNDDMLSRFDFKTRRFMFYYTDNDEEYELTDEPIESSLSIYSLKDENGKWTQNDNNICFRRKYMIRRYSNLFGAYGVACKNAELGLAILWTSSDSKQRGTVKVGSFGYDIDDQRKVIEFEVEKRFLKAQLRGEVTLSTVLYIAKEGIPKSGEEFLANTRGYVLGELDSYTLKLDGNGSSFPIFEMPEPGQPLWRVKCDWDDPTIDEFTEHISIIFNTAHKNYKYIDREQKTFDKQLLTEIMASAVTIIIDKAHMQSAYWDQVINNDGLEHGSVGEAIYYFKDTLGWDISSPDKVSISARKFFDQRM